MKNKTFLFCLILILIIPFINSQDNTTLIDEQKFNLDKIDVFFNPEKSITIPDGLKIPVQIIFGISGEITIQVFIVLIAVWIILFILIAQIITFTPFFKWAIIKWLSSFIIIILIAISGAIKSITILFLNLANLFGILEENAGIAIFIALMIAGILGYGLNKILKILKHHAGLEEASREGQLLAKMVKKAKVMDDVEKDLDSAWINKFS